MNSVRHNLKNLRLKKEMTQDELAERLHVVRQTVSSWETGKTEPGIDTLMEIAEALSVDITELLYGPRPQTAFEAGRPRRKRQAWIAFAVFLFVLMADLCLQVMLPRWYEAKTDIEWGWGDRDLWLFWVRISGILPQLCYFLFPAAALSIAAVFRDLHISPTWLRRVLWITGVVIMAIYLFFQLLLLVPGFVSASSGWFTLLYYFFLLHPAVFLFPGLLFALGLNR